VKKIPTNRKIIIFTIILFILINVLLVGKTELNGKDSLYLKIDEKEISNNNFLRDFSNLEVIYPSDLPDILFTLLACTNDSPVREDILFYLQVELAKIGIALDVQIDDFMTFANNLLYTRNLDMYIVGLTGGGFVPDYTGVYDENGSLNVFGYNTDMDYNATLGTGINEWYLQEGNMIMPPDSQERIDHYWDWQDYMMDKILPVVPLYTPKNYKALWSTLEGYNYSKTSPDNSGVRDLLQSWGHMYWDGLHPGQESTAEVVTTNSVWSDLNPLNNFDSVDRYYINSIMDPMVWYDANRKPHPHIITDWVHFNDTHVRLSIREGIKWQLDPDGLFPNEYLDAEDIYFTLYCWKNLCIPVVSGWCIEDIEIIDDYTVDIFIDFDKSTPENEPSSTYLGFLNEDVLPEHYLNQTQIFDGITPDQTHPSWTTFSDEVFGTGLFELKNSIFSVGMNLTVFDDCWWLNSTITSDPNLDWVDRFGTFSGGLTDLKIKVIEDTDDQITEFNAGKIDLVTMNNETIRSNYLYNTSIEIQNVRISSFPYVGFNGDSSRGTPLQNTDPCPFKPEISIGLAVRKAIAHAIDKETIKGFQDELSDINNAPICGVFGIWLNPNIVTYDYNLTKAKEYLLYAGYETGLDSDSDGLTDLTELNVTSTDRFNADTDSDGLPDGWEVSQGLNPNISNEGNDSDSDDISDYDEYLLGTLPQNNDTDGDSMLDGWEVLYGLDPLIDDSLEDEDDDGLTNCEECLYGTDPCCEDSDADLMPDFWEIQNYLDPLVNDTSDDNDLDLLSNLNEYLTGTDPNNNDTDYDTMPDGWEFTYGLNPLTNDSSLDSDFDGLKNFKEYYYGTDPFNSDTDGDGYLDGLEVAQGSNPADPNEVPEAALAEVLINEEHVITYIFSIVTTTAISSAVISSVSRKLTKDLTPDRSSSISVDENVKQTILDKLKVATEDVKIELNGIPRCPKCEARVKGAFCSYCGTIIDFAAAQEALVRKGRRLSAQNEDINSNFKNSKLETEEINDKEEK